MQYKIEALTPIVTGNSDRIHKTLITTGLIGSLRYQYWLLKAMEAWAAKQDSPKYPPIRQEVQYGENGRTLHRALQEAGPVVRLFGDTNWKRIFRVELDQVEEVKNSAQRSAARPGMKGPPRRWRFLI